MTRPHFLEAISRGVVVGDGAMGTELFRRGVPADACFEEQNLLQPERVRQIHQDYVAAGAQVIETNTFGANAARLALRGLADQVEAINRAGVRLAREAAGTALVAGAVGPLPRHEGVQQQEAAACRRLFRQQMQLLAEEGVDLLVLETFASLEELELACAVGVALGLPVVAQMAFLQRGRSRDGAEAGEAARRLRLAGAAVVGANCGAGPQEALAVIRTMASAAPGPLSAYANAGFPEYVDGRSLYLASPDYFAARGVELAAAGARLIGGCCGTTPDHIAALRRALERSPRPAVPVQARVPAAAPAPATETPPRPFFADWGQRPIITVELDPPLGARCDGLLAKARQLAAAGIDAISLAESPLARIRMGTFGIACRIQNEIGLDTIIHLTCRDRNLIGLHGDLLSAHVLGLRHVLAVTGDPVAIGDEAGAKNVFDLNSVGLLSLLTHLNRGETLLGTPLDGGTAFIAGAAFNPSPTGLDGQLRKLEKKIAAGARFVQTQPVYDAEVLRRMLERVRPFGVPVLVGLLPLVSERNAEFLHNEVPGISIPDEVRARMRGKRGDVGVAEGLAVAAELVEAGRGLAGGWYLMPPFGKVEVALQLVERIRGA